MILINSIAKFYNTEKYNYGLVPSQYRIEYGIDEEDLKIAKNIFAMCKDAGMSTDKTLNVVASRLQENNKHVYYSVAGWECVA